MRNWLVGLGIAVACLVASWGLLVLLARRLPPGTLRDLAAFIPRLRHHHAAAPPRSAGAASAKIAIVVAGLWVASPVDLIPEFLPVIGPLDDIVVVALALRYAAGQVPREVTRQASRRRVMSGARSDSTSRSKTCTNIRGRPTEAIRHRADASSGSRPKAERTGSLSAVAGARSSTGPGSKAASYRPPPPTAWPRKVRPPDRRSASYSRVRARSASTASAATVPCPQAGSSPAAVKNRSDTAGRPDPCSSVEMNTTCDVPAATGTAQRSASLNNVSSTTAVGLPPRPPRWQAWTSATWRLIEPGGEQRNRTR